MSLLLIIRSGQRYSTIGFESDLELVKKDGYQQAVKELAERLVQIADFGRIPSLSIIADTVLYYLDKLQGEIRSLKSREKILEEDLQKCKSTPSDPEWVKNLNWENKDLKENNQELKTALKKERSDRRLEKDRLERRIKELEVECNRLYTLLKWAGENKS